MLDCAHRLLTWNAIFAKLFPLKRVEPETHFVSMLKLLYEPSHGVTALIANPDIFFRAQIRALRYEMQLAHIEPWYSALLDDLLLHCALFAR